MTISVVVPTYNAAEFLCKALESALAQTYQSLEIIVVDDGSTDNTRQVCAMFGTRLKYIYQENDGTFGAGARARAIREARGEWLAFLDHDDLWLASKLQKQVQALKMYPEAKAVFTLFSIIDAADRVVFEPENWSGYTKFISAIDAFHSFLRSHHYVASSALVSRSFIIQHGLTKPADTGAADWDLWLRISRYYPIILIDEPLTLYRESSGQFCSNKKRLAEAMRRTLSAHVKHLHENCTECSRNFQAGQAAIPQANAIAARWLLDQYHLKALSGQLLLSLPFLWQALRIDPKEVCQLRRLLAIPKNAALGIKETLFRGPKYRRE